MGLLIFVFAFWHTFCSELIISEITAVARFLAHFSCAQNEYISSKVKRRRKSNEDYRTDQNQFARSRFQCRTAFSPDSHSNQSYGLLFLRVCNLGLLYSSIKSPRKELTFS